VRPDTDSKLPADWWNVVSSCYAAETSGKDPQLLSGADLAALRARAYWNLGVPGFAREILVKADAKHSLIARAFLAAHTRSVGRSPVNALELARSAINTAGASRPIDRLAKAQAALLVLQTSEDVGQRLDASAASGLIEQVFASQQHELMIALYSFYMKQHDEKLLAAFNDHAQRLPQTARDRIAFFLAINRAEEAKQLSKSSISLGRVRVWRSSRPARCSALARKYKAHATVNRTENQERSTTLSSLPKAATSDFFARIQSTTSRSGISDSEIETLSATLASPRSSAELSEAIEVLSAILPYRVWKVAIGRSLSPQLFGGYGRFDLPLGQILMHLKQGSCDQLIPPLLSALRLPIGRLSALRPQDDLPELWTDVTRTCGQTWSSDQLFAIAMTIQSGQPGPWAISSDFGRTKFGLTPIDGQYDRENALAERADTIVRSLASNGYEPAALFVSLRSDSEDETAGPIAKGQDERIEIGSLFQSRLA
jgi:hypothetical protein